MLATYDWPYLFIDKSMYTQKLCLLFINKFGDHWILATGLLVTWLAIASRLNLTLVWTKTGEKRVLSLLVKHWTVAHKEWEEVGGLLSSQATQCVCLCQCDFWSCVLSCWFVVVVSGERTIDLVLATSYGGGWVQISTVWLTFWNFTETANVQLGAINWNQLRKWWHWLCRAVWSTCWLTSIFFSLSYISNNAT